MATLFVYFPLTPHTPTQPRHSSDVAPGNHTLHFDQIHIIMLCLLFFSLIFTSIKKKQLIKNLLLNKVAEWGCDPQKKCIIVTHYTRESFLQWWRNGCLKKGCFVPAKSCCYIKIRKVFLANCKLISLHMGKNWIRRRTSNFYRKSLISLPHTCK